MVIHLAKVKKDYTQNKMQPITPTKSRKTTNNEVYPFDQSTFPSNKTHTYTMTQPQDFMLKLPDVVGKLSKHQWIEHLIKM